MVTLTPSSGPVGPNNNQKPKEKLEINKNDKNAELLKAFGYTSALAVIIGLGYLVYKAVQSFNEFDTDLQTAKKDNWQSYLCTNMPYHVSKYIGRINANDIITATNNPKHCGSLRSLPVTGHTSASACLNGDTATVTIFNSDVPPSQGALSRWPQKLIINFGSLHKMPFKPVSFTINDGKTTYTLTSNPAAYETSIAEALSTSYCRDSKIKKTMQHTLK